ncbi:MAG: hypothetical protein HGJ94_04035 [Desulfosarcina sp.]|nr:hypothetical protein [Desulfosarcina sp.]MBC2742681.1 hypothetical protein [Desulfosarcina sp.]MBC2765591.1 hypothetical protein [Desulfosarcina sp.]
MISISTENLQQLMPIAAQWVSAKEQVALENGVPLTPDQLSDAKAAGVRHPEKIRVFRVAQIPYPKHPILKAATDATRLISDHTAGIAFRYGIFIKSEFSSNRILLAHELAHIAQYEKLGGISPFLQQYLSECLDYGYDHAPLEKEAAGIANRICQSEP